MSTKNRLRGRCTEHVHVNERQEPEKSENEGHKYRLRKVCEPPQPHTIVQEHRPRGTPSLLEALPGSLARRRQRKVPGSSGHNPYQKLQTRSRVQEQSHAGKSVTMTSSQSKLFHRHCQTQRSSRDISQDLMLRRSCRERKSHYATLEEDNMTEYAEPLQGEMFERKYTPETKARRAGLHDTPAKQGKDLLDSKSHMEPDKKLTTKNLLHDGGLEHTNQEREAEESDESRKDQLRKVHEAPQRYTVAQEAWPRKSHSPSEALPGSSVHSRQTELSGLSERNLRRRSRLQDPDESNEVRQSSRRPIATTRAISPSDGEENNQEESSVGRSLRARSSQDVHCHTLRLSTRRSSSGLSPVLKPRRSPRQRKSHFVTLEEDSMTEHMEPFQEDLFVREVDPGNENKTETRTARVELYNLAMGGKDFSGMEDE